MRYTVLGRLLVHRGEAELPIPSGMQEKLLATLFAGRGASIDADTLVDTLWPDNPPSSARANLRQYVHALRARLGSPARIRSCKGYRLLLLDDTSDADEFIAVTASGTELLAAEQFPQAAEALTRGLGLWQAPFSAFSGLDGPLIAAERERLDTLRGQAIISLCVAERHNGRLANHIGLVTMAFQRDPLDEQLCGYMMRALHAAGRRDEALRTYQTLKRRMSGELGLSPGAELAGVYQEILGPRGASRSVPRRAAPCLLPSNPKYFAGRADEVKAICSYMTGQENSVPVVALYGTGGVGKTELAVRCGHQLRPFYPHGQLFVNARSMEGNSLTADSIIDIFLHALGFPGDEIPREYAARSAVFRSTLTDRQVLIILDDVNDGIELSALIPPTSSSAVLLTSRTPLTSIVGQYNIRLQCPPTADALEMLRFYLGNRDLDDQQVSLQGLVEACGALPLALRIIGGQLALRPHVSPTDLLSRLSNEEQVLSSLSFGSLDVSSALDLSARVLSSRARLLFALAGLLDLPSFTTRTAAALLDAPVRHTEQIVDELVDSQLLDTVVVGGQANYRFHDLVKFHARQLAADAIPQPDATAAIERALGCALAELEEVQTGLSGADHMSIHGPAPRWRPDQADPEVMHPREWVPRKLQATMALVEQAAHLGMHEACWDLAVTMAPLLEVTRDFAAWSHTHRVALRAVRAAGNVRGEAALLTELAEMHLELQELDTAHTLLNRAAGLFDRLNEPRGTALVYEKLGRWSLITGDVAQARRLLLAAAELFRGLGNASNLALVLRCMGQVEMEAKDYPASDALLTEAVRYAKAAGAWRISGQISYRQGNLHLLQNRLGEAEKKFQDVLRLFRDRPEPLGQAYGLLGLGLVHMERGDHPGGKRFLQQAWALADELGEQSLLAAIDSALARAPGHEP